MGQCVPMRPDMDIYMWPVIKSSPFYILVLQAKTQGFDQVQRSLSGSAQAGDVSSVGGYFWLKKNKLHDIRSDLPPANLNSLLPQSGPKRNLPD